MSTTDAADGKKARPRHTRTRAGCLTCRGRKKKCDEVRPRCAGCRRNNLPCDWPPTIMQSDPHPYQIATSSSAFSGSPPAQVALVSPACIAAVTATQPSAGPVPSAGPSVVYLAGGPERACTLTPYSVTFLAHYLRETAAQFAMRPLQDNPFVSILLPLSYADDLLMHSLLALSGAHLSFNDPANTALANATRLHYSRLLGGLRSEFSTLREDDWDGKERLLRVLMIMCHYEAASGDAQGNIFSHLRASGSLIRSLLAHKSGRVEWSSLSNEALGFVIELYTYLLLINSLTYDGSTDHGLPADPFVMSLEDMASFPTFGALFAGGHALYSLIPEVHMLATRRLAEESAGETQPSATLRKNHDEIHSRIASWTMPPALPNEKAEDWTLRQCAAEILRQALYIYLATALAGSIVSDPAVIYVIEDHVRALFTYAPTLAATQYSGAMLWPVVVAGACMVRPEEQQALLHGIRTGRHSMGHLSLVTDILQKLYDDPDPRAYGPYGLYMTMKKHGLSMSIA